MTSDCRFQCSRVGLEVKIYDTPAGGICASQGTFSSFEIKWVLMLLYDGQVTLSIKIRLRTDKIFPCEKVQGWSRTVQELVQELVHEVHVQMASSRTSVLELF